LFSALLALLVLPLVTSDDTKVCEWLGGPLICHSYDCPEGTTEVTRLSVAYSYFPEAEFGTITAIGPAYSDGTGESYISMVAYRTWKGNWHSAVIRAH
ncbi:hypothetical protein PENTCL1PPCAC_451, partial [Pristionchus entomophagus]